MIKFPADFSVIHESGLILSAKVQDYRFQVSRYTFKPISLESYQRVTYSQIRVKNAKHSL